MIVASYGVPGLSMYELCLLFNALNIEYGVAQGRKLVKLNQKPKQAILPVLFSSTKLFLEKQTRLQSAQTRVVVFVLDNFKTLRYELGIPILGAEEKHLGIRFTPFTETHLKEALLQVKDRTKQVTITRTRHNVLAETLKRYNQSSLSELQTFLYKIKDTANRHLVSVVVKKWLASGTSFDSVAQKLRKVLKADSVDTLKSILTTSEMKTFRKAVVAAAKNPDNLKAIATQYGVSTFDVRYLLSTNS
jgi:hypothetical protein